MGRVKNICIYSDQHSWSLSSLQRPFCAATRRLERGREINCAKEDFLFSWQSEDSTVGAFYYRKKIFFNTIKSSPVTTFAVIHSPYFNEAAYLFFCDFSGSLCAGSGRVFISCDLGFEQNTVLGLAKHTITWWHVGFDHYLGGGIHKNLGMG